MSFLEAFIQTLPVLLLILLGVALRKVHFLRPETIADLKKLVVNLTLPLLLFGAFGAMQFELRYLAVVASVFLLCALVLFLSRAGQGISPHFHQMMAGFEAGMMGYAIFSAIYGAANIPRFAVIDLGQVLFVFFVLVTTLESGAERRNLAGLAAGFLRTPVILAILLGLFFNLTGLHALLRGQVLGAVVLSTIGLVAGLTTPLVAVILGYELHFERGNLLRPLLTVLLRQAVWVTLGLLLNFFLLDRLFHLDRIFQAAVMVMFILPPPFVIPLYLRGAGQAERDYIVNTLSIATLAALIAVVVVRLAYGAG